MRLYTSLQTTVSEIVTLMSNNVPNLTEATDADQSSSAAKRDANRDSLFLTANLRFQTGGEEGRVRVRNLSEGGLMAEAAIQATRGTRLEIELKNIGWITGKIAWIAEKKVGIAFDHPIDPKIVRSTNNNTSNNVPEYLKKISRPTSKYYKSGY